MKETSEAFGRLGDDQGGTPDEHAPRVAAYFAAFLVSGVHRRLIPDPNDPSAMCWVRCQGYDEGHEIDSIVHWYHREVGFQRAQEDQDMIDRNPATT